MGVLDFLFDDPSKAAQPYLNKIPGTITPYYQPSINAGNQALPGLQAQYGQMMNDPNGIISRLGAGYHQSPGYQFKLGQGESAINNAQAAGGMLGTPQHQQMAGDLAEKLSNEDFQNYLNSVLGVYQGGIQGNQGLYNSGLASSSELANALAMTMMNQGNLAYSGVQGQNNMTGGIINDIFGLYKGFNAGSPMGG